MNKQEKISPDNFLKKFSRKTDITKLKRLNITSSQITDAMDKLSISYVVINKIKPIFPIKIMGKLVTVDTTSDDWGTCAKAIDTTKKGEILFINVNDDNKAVWGELTSLTAKKKGILSTVVNGAIRDVEAIKKMEYPVFFKNITPDAGGPKAEGKINVSLNFGYNKVDPGDILFGDNCGIVIIPKNNLSEVINETINIKRKEQMILSKIDEGHSLTDILGLK